MKKEFVQGWIVYWRREGRWNSKQPDRVLFFLFLTLLREDASTRTGKRKRGSTETDSDSDSDSDDLDTDWQCDSVMVQLATTNWI